MNCILIAIALAGAAEPERAAPSRDIKAEARFVIAGFTEGRSRLQSGEYSVDGYLDESWGDVRDVGPVEIYSAFDFRRDALRFDRSWMSRPADINVLDPSPTGPAREKGGMYVRLPDRTIRYGRNGNRLVTINLPDRGAPPGVYPLDVRLIGFCCWLTLEKNENLEGLLQRYEPYLFDATRAGAIHQLTWVCDKYTSRWEIHFDSERDYVPIRYELFSRKKPTQSIMEYPLVETVQVTWKELDSVWVPSSCSFDKVRPYPSRRELTFSWKSVNHDLEDAVFSWRSMDLPVGIPVFDERLGTMVHLGNVGETRSRASRTDAAAIPEPPGPGIRLWLVVVSCALLLAVGVVLLRKRSFRATD